MQAELDAGDGVGDLAGDELEAASRTLVVEQDAAAGEQAVALAVVDDDVVTEDLGAAVGRARMERRALGLRGLADLAEHLAAAGLVEADRVVLGTTDHADRLEHAQHARAGDVGRQLGLVEAQGDERDRAEVVDLVGLGLVERLDQRRQVGEVAGHRLDERELVAHRRHPRVVLPLDHAEDLVALGVQELGEVLAILSGDTGDERAGHAEDPWVGPGKRDTAVYGVRLVPRAGASLGLPMDPLRVAFDVGPLAGPRTGVGHAVAAMRESLHAVDDLDLIDYIVSFRSPPPAGARRLPVPALLAHRLWAIADRPRVDRLLGAPDVVHGTNYVVPPCRVPQVVSVYDCWFLRHPTHSGGDVRRAGRVLRRAIASGATVHASSGSTAGELADIFPGCRVVTIPLAPLPVPPPPTAPPIPALAGRPFVAAIGTLERRKNLPVLVEAFGLLATEHDEILLVLAGRRRRRPCRR